MLTAVTESDLKYCYETETKDNCLTCKFDDCILGAYLEIQRNALCAPKKNSGISAA